MKLKKLCALLLSFAMLLTLLAGCGGGEKEIKEDGRGDGQDEADEREGKDSRADENHAEKARHGEKGRRETRDEGSVELLDAGLNVMLAHEVGDDLGGLELLLAVRGGDADSLVEELKVVMCHGHAKHPFHKFRDRHRELCIQSK